MKRLITSSLLILSLCLSLHSQVIVSYEHLEDLTLDQVENIIGNDGTYGVALYKVIYTLLDHNDQLDTVSGLFLAPIDPLFESSLVIYSHGTSSDDNDVPSNLRQGFPDALGFATSGFITVAPDYIGLGESEGTHPYVHAETEALAGLYFYVVAFELITDLNLNPGPELFIAGYSQGAHSSMALQNLLETEFIDDIEVTAAAHGSGPYSVSHVMRELITRNQLYLPVGFIPNFILGYEEIYGNIYDELEDIFKPQYVPQIVQFQNGDIDLVQLTTQLAFSLFFDVGSVIPRFLFQDSIVARLELNDPQDPLIIALRDNDTYNFQALAPTRLYYCEADDVVPFENSIFADSAMQLLGPTDLQLVHVDPNGDHGECALGALPMSVDFFLSFINVGVADTESDLIEQYYPNPAFDQLHLNLKESFDNLAYEIRDLNGRMINKGSINGSEPIIDLTELRPGAYLLFLNSNAQVQVKRFVKL